MLFHVFFFQYTLGCMSYLHFIWQKLNCEDKHTKNYSLIFSLTKSKKVYIHLQTTNNYRAIKKMYLLMFVTNSTSWLTNSIGWLTNSTVWLTNSTGWLTNSTGWLTNSIGWLTNSNGWLTNSIDDKSVTRRDSHGKCDKRATQLLLERRNLPKLPARLSCSFGNFSRNFAFLYFAFCLQYLDAYLLASLVVYSMGAELSVIIL